MAYNIAKNLPISPNSLLVQHSAQKLKCHDQNKMTSTPKIVTNQPRVVAKLTTVPSPAPQVRPIHAEEQTYQLQTGNQQTSQPITPLMNTVHMSLVRTPKVNYNIVDTPSRSQIGAILKVNQSPCAHPAGGPTDFDQHDYNLNNMYCDESSEDILETQAAAVPQIQSEGVEGSCTQ